MFGFGIGEWLLIVFIALLIFGPKAFEKAFGSLKESFSGFSRGLKSGTGKKELPSSVEE